jgi:DNA-binding transcriptional MerR regulator
MHDSLLTVGQLARRLGLRPSALRYYEEQGLLPPTAHSPAGYRLYDGLAEETLAFILRAQRLGFSLADIRALLAARSAGAGSDATLSQIAEARYLALERQITPLLVQRHELAHLLQDMRAATAEARPRLDLLLEQVCAAPLGQPPESALARLLDRSSCQLTSEEGQALLLSLRGQHVHLWQEDGAYHILLVGDDPLIGAALERLARLEADCAAHPAASMPLELQQNDEGFLLIARGDNGFLYARLFMDLEEAAPPA